MDTSDGPPIYVGCRCPPLQQPTNPSRRTHRFYVTHNWNQLSVQWAKSDAHNILTTPTEEARGCKGENKRGLLPPKLVPHKACQCHEYYWHELLPTQNTNWEQGRWVRHFYFEGTHFRKNKKNTKKKKKNPKVNPFRHNAKGSYPRSWSCFRRAVKVRTW